jgi:polysaccharide biosynthesis protein PslH
MARLLVCAQTYPYPANQGGRIRYAHLLEALAKEHDVRLVLVRRKESAETFPAPNAVDITFDRSRLTTGALRSVFSRIPSQFGAFVDRVSGAMIAELARDADAFVAFEPRAGLHHRFIPEEMPRILDFPDSPVLAGRAQWSGDRGFARITHGLENLWKVRMLERELVRAFDVICVAGPRDAARISSQHPGSDCRVIPSAIEIPAEVSPAGLGGALFTGDLSFAPNADAVRFLVSKVWPLVTLRLPKARLSIVGHEPDASLKTFLQRSGCETAFSVPDIEPHFRAATAVVAPMRIGSGIKVKVLMAMASGRPVVMTPLANEGIGAAPEREALVAATPGELADAIVRVLSDDALATRLARAGRELAVRRFAPDVVAGGFLAAVDDALTRSRRGSTGAERQK